MKRILLTICFIGFLVVGALFASQSSSIRANDNYGQRIEDLETRVTLLEDQVDLLLRTSTLESEQEDVISVSGTLQLNSLDNYVLKSDGTCEFGSTSRSGSFAMDLVIEVTDEAGIMVGRDKVEEGTGNEFICKLPYHIELTPSSFYTFNVGGLTTKTLSHAELEDAGFVLDFMVF